MLEHEVIPLFYNRGKTDVPRKWIELMKNSMSEICPFYNTNRMVREYTEWYYLPALNKFNTLFEKKQKKAKELADWKAKLNKNWPEVYFEDVSHNGKKEYQVGNEISISAKVHLENLSPDDVSVEIYHGFLDAQNKIIKGKTDNMECVENNGNNVYNFVGTISCQFSGLYGYTLRILPNVQNLMHPHETGLIVWSDSDS